MEPPAGRRRARRRGGRWCACPSPSSALSPARRSYAVNRLNAYDAIFHFGSALSASFWPAIIAFI
jgi:hypothetical protein